MVKSCGAQACRYYYSAVLHILILMTYTFTALVFRLSKVTLLVVFFLFVILF